MKIKRLELNNYKLFKGKHVFEFADGLTLIKGGSGSGKTILFNAMRNSLTKSLPGVKLTLSGKASQLAKHRKLIFIEGEKLGTMTLRRYPKFKKYVLKTTIQDRIGQDLWYIVIDKRKMGFKLPLIIDRPYARLNLKYQKRLTYLLKKEGCQLIFLGNESEFKSVEADKEYILGSDKVIPLTNKRKGMAE